LRSQINSSAPALLYPVLLSAAGSGYFILLAPQWKPVMTGALAFLVFFAVLFLSARLNSSSRHSGLEALFLVLQMLILLAAVLSGSKAAFAAAAGAAVLAETARWYSGKIIESSGARLTEKEMEMQQLNDTFLAVRKQRHDFLKHVSAVQYMLDKGQFSEAKVYFGELLSGYEEVNLAIKGENGPVAGVLHHMQKKASAEGISIHYDLELPLSSLPMKDADIAALAGNILSNSIEAAAAYKASGFEDAYARLQFYKRSGLMILTCSNSTLPVPQPIIDSLFERFGMSNKEGEHEGLGTKIIKDIVLSYNGCLDYTHKGRSFEIKIKIPHIS
jgi:two-component system, LytTR family, sensor histidine kinase NatK